MSKYILSIDQGTTSSRALVFDHNAVHVTTSQQEFTQHFPENGWVEHDPEDIWHSTLAVIQEAASQIEGVVSDIVAVGITNQRETCIVWDRESGKPVYNAIVWQDRRTAKFCEFLKAQGLEGLVIEKTGLLIDPYFSASKIAWILDEVDGARALADQGRLAFGTIDCFLLWRFTKGKSHATDATNASRTSLFNIHTQEWDDELLALFNVPKSLLPEVKDSSAHFGMVDSEYLGADLPILSMIGDQQAALVGQACFEPGMLKSTYGTGCFVILNTGEKALKSNHRLLTTIAYRLNGRVTYALEGSIFVAGAAVQWLRDGLHLIQHAGETESIAQGVGYQKTVFLVPAFTGLGAPYWDPHARGAIFGLTRDTGLAEIVTAGLQSVAYQTRDLLEAMQQDGARISCLRVDGGMVQNVWLTQLLADILEVDVDKPRVIETTALGAAYLAAIGAGLFSNIDEVAKKWSSDQRFSPAITHNEASELYSAWKNAVSNVLSYKAN
jgi:glycerol kinase